MSLSELLGEIGKCEAESGDFIVGDKNLYKRRIGYENKVSLELPDFPVGERTVFFVIFPRLVKNPADFNGGPGQASPVFKVRGVENDPVSG